jgi:SAM-dependent methyltransferase
MSMAIGGDAFGILDGGTRSYYETDADGYARETQASLLPEIWGRMEAHVAPGGRLLDLGCGAGRDLRHFSAAGYSAVGLDRSFALTRIARTFSGCSVVAADFRALPFRARCFDAVYAIASLLHAERTDLPGILAAARDLLRPHGVLLATFKAGQGEVVDGRGRFTALYEPSALRNLVEGVDLRVLDAEVSTEIRRGNPIPWITLLARAPGPP